MLNNEYNKMDAIPPIRQYAFLGDLDSFIKKLNYLATLAEPENWYYDNPNFKTSAQKKVGVLYQYIFHTFSKAQEDKKIYETNDYSIFNTGLLSQSGEEIYMLFSKNKRENAQIWYFNSFFEGSAHEIPVEMRSKLPKYVDYFETHPELMYFDPNLEIFGNVGHIVNQRSDRLPSQLRQIADNQMIMALVNAAKITMEKRIRRNNRLVVPQYWNKKIMYLAPLQFGEDYVALAIEKNEDTYRINTVLTQDMAYCNARLLMKPESNWLHPNKNKE